MSGNISKNKMNVLLIYICYLLIIISCLFLSNKVVSIKWNSIIFGVIISHIIVTLSCFKYMNIKIFSISVVFVLSSYIFHLGQVILKVIAPNYIFAFDVSEIMGREIYEKSICFSLIIISMISIGIILGNKKVEIDKKVLKQKKNIATIIKLGWIITFLTMPIEIYQTYMKFIASNQAGYLEVLNVESSGIVSQIARFHLIGISLLIMGYSNKSKKTNGIYIVYTVYSIITMLTGSRIYSVVSIFIITYIFLKVKNKRISLKVIIFGSISIFYGIVLLNTLAEVRAEGISDLTNLIRVFKDNINDNPIFDIIEEFGSTIYTVCLTVLKVPSTIEYSAGKQFLTSFASVLPNINGVFSEINREANFVYSLNVEAIGGSYIAELYYSFKYICYLLAIIMGMLLQKISRMFEYYIEKEMYLKAVYFILPTFSIIIWVRGTFQGILRNTIWSIIFIYIMDKILVKAKYRKIKTLDGVNIL